LPFWYPKGGIRFFEKCVVGNEVFGRQVINIVDRLKRR